MSLGRVSGALLRLMKRETARFDYLALYPARVVAQNANGTVELVVDDERIPGLSQVPLRLGVPGVTVKVAPGSRVLLGYEAGDPRRPVGTLWELSSVLELQVDASVKVTLASAQVLLGGIGAVHPVAQGEVLNAALTAFGTAVAAAFTAAGGGAPGAAVPVLGAALTALGTSITAATTALTASATAALSPTTRTL